MKPELETLLKLLDAYLEGDPRKADDLFDAYHAQLQEYSALSQIPVATLDSAITRLPFKFVILQKGSRHGDEVY